MTMPRGGTEILADALFSRLPKELSDRVHISISVPHERPDGRPVMLWQHQSDDQPCVQPLRDPRVRENIALFVFVSEWQKKRYIERFGIDPEKAIVIRNAIEPIPVHEKPYGPIRLVYTSTPFRGLEVLLDAFELLRQKRDDVELHVYSGMSIYGAERAHEDTRFAHLYERAQHMPGVTYHGVQPNDMVREALKSAHIFAYPSTWEETSCLAAIEALSAGLLAVVPTLGALPETCAPFGQLYPYTDDTQEHAMRFAAELERAVDRFWEPGTQAMLALQRTFFHRYYSWDRRIEEWKAALLPLARQAEGKRVWLEPQVAARAAHPFLLR